MATHIPDGNPNGWYGTLGDLACHLYNEQHLLGSSVLEDEMRQFALDAATHYTAYEDLRGCISSQPNQINPNTKITLGEFALISVVAKAQSQLAHAIRVDMTAAIGGERYGLDVTTAQQNYNDALQYLRDNAYIALPFVVSDDD